MNKAPETKQKGNRIINDESKISVMPKISPGGEIMLFDKYIKNPVSIGKTAIQNCITIIIVILIFDFFIRNFPKYDPVAVNNIQFARIIPKTNSFPRKTDKKILSRIIWDEIEEIPKAIIEYLRKFSFCNCIFLSLLNYKRNFQ